MADLIDRQAAIDAFYVQSDDDGWWTGTAQDMEELLQGLPSVDVRENVHGLWIDVDPYGDSGLAFKCSECEKISIMDTNYCPNCGADMRGEP